MVTAVSNDPTLQINSEKTARSHAGELSEREKGAASTQTQGASARQPEIDAARRLFQMESAQGAREGQGIQGPEQARDVLERVLQQLQENPASAMGAFQAPGASQIAHLLESAPA